MISYRCRKTGFALLLTLALLLSLAVPAALAEGEQVFEVGSVEELIAALGSDRVVRLKDGEYNLSMTASYYSGDTNNPACRWDGGYDGSQLVLTGLKNLRLEGGGRDRCRIVTEPRYANVLCLEDCENLVLSGICLGHTRGAGICSGGVLDLADCENTEILSCELYGCGTLGISAQHCESLIVRDTLIRDCSYGAIEARGCFDLRFEDGEVLRCGTGEGLDEGWYGFNLFYAQSCTGFAVLNSQIADNICQVLFRNDSSDGFLLAGCEVSGNTAGIRETWDYGSSPSYTTTSGGLFQVDRIPVTVTGTSFLNNRITGDAIWESEASPVYSVLSPEGTALEFVDFMGMQQQRYEGYEPPVRHELPALDGTVNNEGVTEYHVNTPDEFLAAIGSNTVIHIDAERLDFSTASNYGGYGGKNYSWIDYYDGPSLIISDVENLSILGLGRDRTTLLAVPRYANVLRFENCCGLKIADLTAGHTPGEAASCTGDVLSFSGCDDVIISGCGLFGCGVNGIAADNSSGFVIEQTAMYSCSYCGADLWSCSGFRFENCEIYDCQMNGLNLYECRHIRWNGAELPNNAFTPVES